MKKENIERAYSEIDRFKTKVAQMVAVHGKDKTEYPKSEERASVDRAIKDLVYTLRNLKDDVTHTPRSASASASVTAAAAPAQA